jgi:tetratricopeptide (TPR) repeat protein
MLHSLERLNKPEVAERYWLKALEVAPEYVDTHYTLAFLYNKMSRLEDAAQQWRTIIHWLVTARDISPAQEVSRAAAGSVIAGRADQPGSQVCEWRSREHL